MKTMEQINVYSLFCDECTSLAPTERQQEEEHQRNPKQNRMGHYCEKYKQLLKHYDQHPHIPRLMACLIDGAKSV